MRTAAHPSLPLSEQHEVFSTFGTVEFGGSIFWRSVNIKFLTEIWGWGMVLQGC